MARYYIDTCIWRDYAENRIDNLRPLGEWAFAFFQRAVKEQYWVYTSDMVVIELLADYTEKEIAKIFSIISDKGLLQVLSVTKSQNDEARKIARKRKLPFADVLYAIVARDVNSVVVSRDKHFMELLDICTVAKPEELL